MSEEQRENFDSNEGSMKVLVDAIAEPEPEDNWMVQLSKSEGSYRKYGIEQEHWDRFLEENPGAQEFFYMIKPRLDFDQNDKRIARALFNTSDWSTDKVDNVFTNLYFKAIKEGKNLKQDIIEFAYLDRFLYVQGKYFMPPGTSPQDGEHEDVYNVLKLGADVLEDYVKERRAEREEWEAEA